MKKVKAKIYKKLYHRKLIRGIKLEKCFSKRNRIKNLEADLAFSAYDLKHKITWQQREKISLDRDLDEKSKEENIQT